MTIAVVYDSPVQLLNIKTFIRHSYTSHSIVYVSGIKDLPTVMQKPHQVLLLSKRALPAAVEKYIKYVPVIDETGFISLLKQ